LISRGSYVGLLAQVLGERGAGEEEEEGEGGGEGGGGGGGGGGGKGESRAPSFYIVGM
jgi:hypothetical protein